MTTQNSKASLFVGIATFAFWGLVPIYWKFLTHVPAGEALAHRLMWFFVFVFLVVLFSAKLPTVWAETKVVFKDRRKIINLFIGTFAIGLNWLAFIWAINQNRVVETSLAYYISPILSVIVAMIFLRERLSLWQLVAAVLAFSGVLILTYAHGTLPKIALFIAITMTIYTYCKKVVGLSTLAGLTLESFILFPLAFAYWFYLASRGESYPITLSPTIILLVGSSLVTTLPLMTFAYSINRLPLSLMGILLYITPSISLCLGIFVYGEPFTDGHKMAFAFIWAAVLLFVFAKTKAFAKMEQMAFKKR